MRLAPDGYAFGETVPSDCPSFLVIEYIFSPSPSSGVVLLPRPAQWFAVQAVLSVLPAELRYCGEARIRD